MMLKYIMPSFYGIPNLPKTQVLYFYITKYNIAVEKQRRYSVNNLKFGVQLADVLTRWSSHPQGISEGRYENAGAL